MGDRAGVGITVYDCPPEDVTVLFDFLVEHGFIDDDEILLGEQFWVEEVSLGFCSKGIVEMLQKVRGVTIEASQGNRYEFNGEQLYHTPELGLFCGEMSGRGDIVLTEADVNGIYKAFWPVNGAPSTAAEFKAELDKAFGRPWIDHFAALAAEFMVGEERWIKRPTCKDCGNPIEKTDAGWAEVNWGDERDSQCGLSESGVHEPDEED